jgi:beta-N-acetylhexosaminidase
VTGGDGAARRLAASLVVAGFQGTALPDWVETALRGGLAGVVLFRRNVESAAQVAALAGAIRAVAPAAFVCIDHEGGRVQRLRAAEGFTEWPSARAVSARGGPDEARAAAAAMGRELRAVGVDVSFAPVLDVDTNAANPVIGDRAYASDPVRVAQMGVAVAEGLGAAGVLACGKHFPGHGDTGVDSHVGLPVVLHDLARLRAVELMPFGAAARARIPAVMTAHVVVPALEPGVPATCSAAALRLLREELGFAGCIVSDDLEMKAIDDPAGAAVAAVRAGVDLVLVCSARTAVESVLGALASEAAAGPERRRRLEEAAERVAVLRGRAEPARPLRDEALHAALRDRNALELAARLGGPAAGPDPTERA